MQQTAPPTAPMHDVQRDKLQALVLTRRKLVDQRPACKNRLAAPGSAAVAPYLKKLVATVAVMRKMIVIANAILRSANDISALIHGSGG